MIGNVFLGCVPMRWILASPLQSLFLLRLPEPQYKMELWRIIFCQIAFPRDSYYPEKQSFLKTKLAWIYSKLS